MRQVSVTDLRPSLDPWHGLGNYKEKAKELNLIIDQLNTWIPHTIPGYFDVNNPELSLNQLHVHFPEQQNVETDPVKLKQLTVYNDLIHQIDLGIRSKGKNLFLLLCPNSNLFETIQDEDYKLFQPYWIFGDLMLHYPHVGRHPYEIFTTNDIDCPPDQIVCQSKISTFHTLRFSSAYLTKDNFKNFYYESGIKWPYDFDNKKLSFGYIKLGQLATVNDEILDKESIIEIVKSSSKITNWNIY